MTDWLMIPYPPGEPERIGAAVSALRAGSQELADLADDFGAAVRSSRSGWTGTAASTFLSTSGAIGVHLSTTASAHHQIAGVLDGYGSALDFSQATATRTQRDVADELGTYAARGRSLAWKIADDLEGPLALTGIGTLAETLLGRLRSWDLPPGFSPYLEAGASPGAFFSPEAIVADLSGPAGAGLSALLMEMPTLVLDLIGEGRHVVASIEDDLAVAVSSAQSSLSNALSDLRRTTEQAASVLSDVGERAFALVPDPSVLGHLGGDARSFMTAVERFSARYGWAVAPIAGAIPAIGSAQEADTYFREGEDLADHQYQSLFMSVGADGSASVMKEGIEDGDPEEFLSGLLLDEGVYSEQAARNINWSYQIRHMSDLWAPGAPAIYGHATAQAVSEVGKPIVTSIEDVATDL